MTPAAVSLRVPAALLHYCGGAGELALSGATVRAALSELSRRQPALYACVCDETGAQRRHVNIFVNENNTRDGRGLDTPLASGDVVTVLPAVSGG